MKISQVILALQQIQAEHGDVDVCCRDDYADVRVVGEVGFVEGDGEVEAFASIRAGDE